MKYPRVLLIYPRLQFRANDIAKPDGSLSLPYLAGALRRAGFDVKILDASVGTEKDSLDVFYKPTMLPSGLVRVGISDERLLEEVKDYDLIGITSIFTMQTRPILEMVRLIRAAYPEKDIIAGGVNARSLATQFFKAGVDIVFTSEADEAIVEFAKGDMPNGAMWVENDGELKRCSTNARVIHDLDKLAIPAWDLLPNDRYWTIGRPHGGDFPPGAHIKYASMMTSRGCPFACSYCHISKELSDADMAGPIGGLRLKSIDRVMQEAHVLKDLGVEYLFLEDDSLLAKKKRIYEILRQLGDLGMTLVDVNGVNLAHLMRNNKKGGLEVDTELLDMMAHAGFKKLVLPFESGNQRVLDKWASKKWRIEMTDTAALIRECESRGITTLGNYTIGYPDETFDEVMQSILMARAHVDAGLSVASFFIIVPFPGTTLYDTAVANGQLDPNLDPDEYNWTRSVFKNAPVSPETLERVRQVAWTLINRKDFVQSRKQLSAATLATPLAT